MASTDRVTKAVEASFGVQKRIPRKNNNDWYVLEAMHSSNVSEAWCGDNQTMFCSPLTRDGIGLSFSSCKVYMSEWCKEANSAKW